MNLKSWEILLLMKLKNSKRITSKIYFLEIKMIYPWFGKKSGSLEHQSIKGKDTDAPFFGCSL